jgi:hypothetical protein
MLPLVHGVKFMAARCVAGFVKSVVLIRINIIDEFFKPAWTKNNHKQSDRTGNRNGPNTKNHEDNKDYRALDSGPARNGIHGYYLSIDGIAGFLKGLNFSSKN